ncbi:hypothetical protein [Microlunatus flavus]|uniref:Uncharacterized protein n=1 Tax=Microlunatus flavus TaxID=1036181 RepID=A0A1H9C2L7_9ACTN|nr:hypothetical protein [Microlunatus flavus]SEP95429.1 hypothetical protein SAMN05421756_10253 [Microlunatus flavus]
MLPTTWTPYRRAEDDELLGHLEDRGDGVVPLTLFGAPLAAPGTRAEAEAVLDARGLASLAEPWLLRQADGVEVRVAVVAAYPDRVLVVPAPYGYADPAERTVVVAAEDGAVLLRPYA